MIALHIMKMHAYMYIAIIQYHVVYCESVYMYMYMFMSISLMPSIYLASSPGSPPPLCITRVIYLYVKLHV